MAEEKGEWRQFPEAERYIQRAVEQWHPHLAGAAILAVSRPEAPLSGDKREWGKLKLASPMERALYGDLIDYVMILPMDVWNGLTDKGRMALVDHELCHAAGLDVDTEKWTLKKHDLEEFAAVITRHGIWRADAAYFIEQTKGAQVTIDEMLASMVGSTLAEQAAATLRPKPGSGIDAVSITVEGQPGVTFHADGRTTEKT